MPIDQIDIITEISSQEVIYCMNQKIQLDPLYQRAIQFAQKLNMNQNTVGLSNLYVIQKRDRSGSLIGEYYGMNLMTDYGMQQCFVNGTTFPTSLYIGNGSGSFSYDTNALLSPITTTAATVSSSTKSYQYPLYYDAETGLITATSRALIVYFDYNISGISGPIVISEYGIGTSTTALWTHSWVYDNLGHQTTITKNVNERLDITVYFCMSYSKSMIESGWTNGKYIAITTMERFFNRMRESNVRTFKRFNVGSNRSKTNTESVFDNITHSITTYANMSPFTLSRGSTNDTGYIDGTSSWTNGFCMIEHDVLPTSESFDLILKPYTSNLVDNESLAMNFGDPDLVQCTDVDIQHSYTFNHSTGNYDIAESFDTTQNKWFTDTTMSTYFAIPIYYTANQTITQMYLYQNLKSSDPIVQIKGALSTVYATDAYWDTSQWTLITDLSNIPVSEQYRKYWITTNNTVNLDPVYGNPGYQVGVNAGSVLQFTQSFPTGICQSFGHKYQDTYTSPSYLLMDNYLFDIKRLVRHEITSTTGFGNIRSFDVTNGSDGVKFETIQTGSSYVNKSITTRYSSNQWTNTENTLSANVCNNVMQSYITFDDTYFHDTGNLSVFCLKDSSNGDYAYAGLGGLTTLSSTLFSDAYTICSILRSSGFAYAKTVSSVGDPHVIAYYNRFTNPTITNYSLPGTINHPVWMFGYDHWLYVTDGSSYMYVINLTTGSISECDGYIPWTSNLHLIRQTATSDCMILYRSTDTTMANAYVVRADDPTHLTSLASLDQGVSSRRTGCQYTLQKWGNTNVLLYTVGYYNNSGVSNEVFDFSHWLYDETVECVRVTSRSQSMYIMYDDLIAQQNQLSILGNYIPHRITGTTRTITTMNELKYLSNKQWSVTYTNIPSFNGLPPGVQQ